MVCLKFDGRMLESMQEKIVLVVKLAYEVQSRIVLSYLAAIDGNSSLMGGMGCVRM